MIHKSTIPTLTQKYNDLHTLVKASYTDKQEREDVWQSIRKILLNPYDNSIHASTMELFEGMIELGSPIGHKDIYQQNGNGAFPTQIILPMIERKEIDRPWCCFKTGDDANGEFFRVIFRRIQHPA